MAREKIRLPINEKLRRYIKILTKSMVIDKIILFGSYAKGEAHKYSDIDIAIVSPELDPRECGLANTRKVKEKTKLIEPMLQLFAYPTSLFNNARGTVHESFIDEIKKTGKVIYSSNSKRVK